MFASSNLIALDIGSSSIKLCEFSGGKSRRLENLGIEFLPPGIIQNGFIQDMRAVSQALQALKKKTKVSRWKKIALSVGGNSVLTKKVTVDVQKDSTFEEQAYFVAEQAFQVDLTELYFDAQPFEGQNNKTGAVDAIVVGAKKELVDQHIAAIRNAGFDVGAVECEALSLANMFEYNYGVIEGLVALVNIGGSSCQVMILKNGQFVYSRDIQIGGEIYTRKICENLNLDYETAESLKISVSSESSNQAADVADLINHVNIALVAEIRSTIEYFLQGQENPSDQLGINHIFLIGGASRTLGLNQNLMTNLQIPVHALNPFQRVTFNARNHGVQNYLRHSESFAIAAGLALRQVNDRTRVA